MVDIIILGLLVRNMKKIIVLGCSGSGKSTFAIKLHEKLGLPLYHLDNIWWKDDRTHMSREEFDEKLDAVRIRVHRMSGLKSGD